MIVITYVETANSREKPWVLVEWRSYRIAKGSLAQRQAKDQAKRVAYDLGIRPKPTGLRTLDCIGLVEDQNRFQFGLLFRVPPGVDVKLGPITLHSYLCNGKLDGKLMPFPTLGDRIQLAYTLARSLTELRVIGLFHKNFHSGNVFFFPTRFTKEVTLRKPYVGGFEVSRPEHDRNLSISTNAKAFDLYRHPDLRDPSNQWQGRPPWSFKYDVYGLGMVLLEIGLFQPLQRVVGTTEQSSSRHLFEAKRCINVAKINLPHMMGPLYCEAVLDCIDFERPAVEDPTALAEKVLKRLEQCHCRA